MHLAPGFVCPGFSKPGANNTNKRKPKQWQCGSYRRPLIIALVPRLAVVPFLAVAGKSAAGGSPPSA
jgi:hypothetical protein